MKKPSRLVAIPKSDRGFEFLPEFDKRIKEQKHKLAKLKAEIRSRKRMVGDTGGVEIEVLVRDRQIEELNEQVVAARAINLEKPEIERKSKILEIEARNLKISQERDDFETKLFKLQEFIGENRPMLENHEEIVRSQELVYTQKINKLKLGLKQKDSDLSQAKTDIAKLAEVIEELKQINKENNEKLENLNIEIEEIKLESLNKDLKLKELEQDKEMYVSQIDISKENEAFKKQVGEVLQPVVNRLGNLDKIEESDFLFIKEELREIIELVTPLIEPNFRLNLTSPQLFIKDLQSKLKNLEILNSKSNSEIENLHSQIKFLETSLSKTREKSVSNLTTLYHKLDLATQETNNYKQKVEELHTISQKKEILEAQARGNVNLYRKRNGELRGVIKSLDEQIKQLQSTIKELRSQMLHMATDKRSFEIKLQQSDKKIREINSKLVSTKQLIFEKDTKILHSEKAVVQLNKDIEDYKLQVASFSTKMRGALAEESRGYYSKIKAREQEIEALKNIIKTSIEKFSPRKSEAMKDLRTNFSEAIENSASISKLE